MSDPIERLEQMRSDIAGGPMLPAANVRRRGDTLRRRKNALITAASATAVAAIAVPIFVVSGDASSKGNEIEPAPAPSAPLSDANLMTDADTVFDQRSDWLAAPKVGATEGQGSQCQKLTYADLGATAEFDRDWGLAPVANTDATDSTHFLHQDVVQFKTSSAAEDAYDQVVDWITTCEPDPLTDYTSETPSELTLPDDGQGTFVSATHQRDGAQGGEAYTDVQTNTVIIVSGDRLSLIQHTMPNADYRWPNDQPPVQLMSGPAAERLAGPGTSESEEAAATSIPDDFPLTDGWQEAGEESGPETKFTAPGPIKDPLLISGECDGVVAEGPGFLDGRQTIYSQPEDFRIRELLVYDNSAGADAMFRSVLDVIRGCPLGDKRGDGYRSQNSLREIDDVGDEAWAVLQTDTLDGSPTPYGQTTLIIRFGQALLEVQHAGHSGTPRGDGAENVEEMLAELETVIDEMCQFSAGGC